MKTITLRMLVREPLKVKRITRTGKPVQVTDHGHPLWVIQPAALQENEEQRREQIEELFEEVRRGPQSKIALSKLVLNSRR